MTKKLLAVLAALSILLMPLHSYADKDSKGPSDQAYKNANDNAAFKRDDQNNDKKKNKDKKKDKDKKKNKDKDGKDKEGKNKKKNKNDKDKKKKKDKEITSEEHIQNKFGIQ